MDKKILGQRIRAKRKEQKLTMEQLAEKLDVSIVFVGEMERGVKLPSLKTFIALVNALEISSDELIYDKTTTGKHYLADEITKAMSNLTPEEYAAVSKITLTAIEQIKNLRCKENQE